MSHGQKQSLKEGYEKFVIKNESGCWGWSGCVPTNPKYGQFRHGMKLERAHRASWILNFGEIPKGKWVLHKCDNSICSRPEHLFLGDNITNIKDMMDKKRSPILNKSGEKNPRARLTYNQVKKIKEIAAMGSKRKDIANLYNVSIMVIHRIIHGKAYREAL